MSKRYDSMYDFMDIVSIYLKKGQKVTDIGGGTGLFSQYLQDKQDIELSFVEPSKHMMDIARGRVHGTLYNDPFSDVIDKLDTQDMFIFMRCFYCLYNSIEEYAKIPFMLYDKLNEDGIVSIYWIGTTCQFDIYEKLDFLDSEENAIYNAVRMEYNRLLSTGEFNVFGDRELDNLFVGNGFELIYRHMSKSIYRKV